MRTDPVSARLSKNIAVFREGVSLRELAARLLALGYKILPSGVMGIEKGTRRLDAGELVALAMALGVTPNRLLLPDNDAEDPAEIVPGVAVPPAVAWQWACGDYPLPAQSWEPRRSEPSRAADFREVNRPHDPDSFNFEDMSALRAKLAPLWDDVKSAAREAGVSEREAVRFLQFMVLWESIPTAGGDS